VTVEGVAAELAVGDDVQAGGLLHRDRRVDRRVLDLLQLGRADRTGLICLPSGDERGWPKQAANDIRTGDHVTHFDCVIRAVSLD